MKNTEKIVAHAKDSSNLIPKLLIGTYLILYINVGILSTRCVHFDVSLYILKISEQILSFAQVQECFLGKFCGLVGPE